LFHRYKLIGYPFGTAPISDTAITVVILLEKYLPPRFYRWVAGVIGSLAVNDKADEQSF
jgi:hypothetical protein